ncbi:GNAT family N-acetyltransferase [bacterium]|nr:GNAT family N-acetyltransferase [bacterium]
MLRGINDLIIRQVRTYDELDMVFKIRERVFTIEQDVPEYIERDGKDDESTHFVGIYRGVIVACARLRFIDNAVKLERMAVLEDYRGRKIASQLLKYMLKQCPIEDFESVILNSQYYLREFYQKYGFVTFGDPFDEAGIKHVKMIKKLSA